MNELITLVRRVELECSKGIVGFRPRFNKINRNLNSGVMFTTDTHNRIKDVYINTIHVANISYNKTSTIIKCMNGIYKNRIVIINHVFNTISESSIVV